MFLKENNNRILHIVNDMLFDSNKYNIRPDIFLFKILFRKQMIFTLLTEATTGHVLQKKLFLKISKYSQENTYVGILF